MIISIKRRKVNKLWKNQQNSSISSKKISKNYIFSQKKLFENYFELINKLRFEPVFTVAFFYDD